MENTSFKAKSISALITSAREYARLLESFYIFQSDDFKSRNFYIISFNEENFLHLTGVKTTLKALDFYKKCFEGTISGADFDCDSDKILKGKVKEKMKHLPNICSIILQCYELKESFSKGRVTCILVGTQKDFTVGFDGVDVLYPKTLMHKNRVDSTKAITHFETYKVKKTAKAS